MAVDERPPRPDHEGSLADQAYRLLRNDLIRGIYEPGQPLRLEALKERYGFSFSPLREALTRLSRDQLVVLSAARGFRVATASCDEIRDVTDTRILIESQALRLAIERGGDEWESRIVAALYSLNKCVERRHSASVGEFDDVYSTRHADFHEALISACGSPSLLHMASHLHTLLERYCRVDLSDDLIMGDGDRDVAREHQALVDATLARDADRAVQLLADHYKRTGVFLKARMESVGGLVRRTPVADGESE